MKRAAWGLVTLLVFVSSISAQAPVFDVASIKPNPPGSPRFVTTPPGGRFIATGLPVAALVAYAYRVRPSEVSGGPAWAHDDQWEIQAKAPEGYVAPAPPADIWSFDWRRVDTMGLMLQSLLEDRFKLKIRRETGELPMYELVPARGGSKLRPSEDQAPPTLDEVDAQRTLGPNGRPQLRRGGMMLSRGRIQGKAVPVAGLAIILAQVFNRDVINKTNLDGLYDIDLQWTPDEPAGAAAGGPPANPDVIQGATTIFTAIQEQLGLRLVSVKAPGDVIVIESVQRPEEN